jgi:hypothetical protein
MVKDPGSKKKAVIHGSMNDSSYLHHLGLHHVKHEIVSDYQHSISEFSQAIISGSDTKVRIVCRLGNRIIELLTHGSGSRRIVLHDVIENLLQIRFRCW